MDVTALVHDLGIYPGSFVVCLVSGFVPVVNAELYLIGVVALGRGSYNIWWLVLMATLGQMTAKVVIYGAARGMFDLSLSRYEAAVARWRERLECSEPRLSLFILASAFAGLPPFLIISILAGMFRVSLVRFCILGLCGRFARFALFALFPRAMMELF